MATQRGKTDGPRLTRRLMEELMFGAGRVRRFTQDTPVLPDVWLAYADCLDEGRPTARGAAGGEAEANPAIKLLLTPWRKTTVGEVRSELCARLAGAAQRAMRQRFGHPADLAPRVVYNQTTLAATLHFEDLIRAVLPMTEWWSELTRKWNVARIGEVIEPLALAVEDPEHPRPVPRRGAKPARPTPGLLWMLRVVGALALHLAGEKIPWERVPSPRVRPAGPQAGKPDPGWKRIVQAVADLVADVESGSPAARLFSVSLNRDVSPTVARSVLAVKADAARQLFNISCAALAWAVIDSGIDAEHPAFRLRDAEGRPHGEPFATEKGRAVNRTRVVETYDFSEIELLLDPDTAQQPASVSRRLGARAPGSAALRREIDDLNRAVRQGRYVDWQQLAPLLRVPHEKGSYQKPGHDHGTHVAGILAGHWKAAEAGGALEEDLTGVAPDLKLFDLRVLDADGRGDEFAVMAALQFIRHLNAAHDYVVVHGANLSLSIPHDVANYACGRTPVCEECERVVAAGVVVVAAAGNQGYRRYRTAEDGVVEAYNSSSITDPGNADAVITVGATHRYRPHVYGVSYFSSRGPTGDGRRKPDLVAPGEKITAPLPDELYGPKDGTSMAAPHVSGGAALLMARHLELVGQPVRVKEILCTTATDLGREPYFQGAGMLDILRALQSV